VAVEDKAELDQLAVPAGDLEDITAPALVRDVALNQAAVRVPGAASGGARELPAIQVHQALNTLEVVAGRELAIDERPDAPRAIGGPRPNHRADLRRYHPIVGPGIPRRASHAFPVRARPADPQGPTDRR